MRDDLGSSMVEYAIIAACLAVPLLAIAAAIATTAGNNITSTNSGMVTLGQTPP